MGTKAETIRVSARPAGFMLWTAAVSALAAAALIMSAVALTVAIRDRAVTGAAIGGVHEAASNEVPKPWTAACSPRASGSTGTSRAGTRPSSKPWTAACSPRASGSTGGTRRAVIRLISCTVEAAVRAQVHPGGREDLERVAVRGLHSARTPTLESSRPPTMGGRGW